MSQNNQLVISRLELPQTGLLGTLSKGGRVPCNHIIHPFIFVSLCSMW